MEIPKQLTPVQIDKIVHAEMLSHIGSDKKIGKWTEDAIRNQIRREKLQEIKVKEILEGSV